MNFGPSNLAGGVAGSIRASHGSPHKFEKFDLSKIGTGEGAQEIKANTFGFTENEAKEASEYLNNLGIPGLKYLDQRLRGAPDGTRNVNSKPVKKSKGGAIDMDRINSIIDEFHQGEYGVRSETRERGTIPVQL